MKPYTLTIDEDGMRAIDFWDGRNEWASVLRPLSEGANRLTEHEAWKIKEALEADTEGGHSMLPGLEPSSALHAELTRFMGSIV